MNAIQLFRAPKPARPTATALGLIALLGAAPAFAADMIEAVPEPAPVIIEEAPITGWSGAYLGVQGGYGFNESDVEGAGEEIDADGAVGGVFGGFNAQTGQFVYGVEGDVGYSGAEGETDGNEIGTQDGVEGALRARLGYAITDNVLIYGAAGGAAKQMTVAEGAESDKKGMLGYTVGAGTDVKITDQIFARGEYRFNDYGSENFDVGGGREVESQDHRVQFGLGMQF
ncbi:MAG TPA: outer membrane protein [Mesorhizobium sp.]|jgi:outer membrane immunogenic protein|nr:outer membrane protein [Mesorhizobium sp.]